MKQSSLNDMVKGWFVGNFEPAVEITDQFEVAVKKYNKGDHEETHFHKIATEITVIVTGHVLMNGVSYTDNDIVVMSPGEATNFEVITDTTTVVVKFPSVREDKFTEC